MTNNEGNRAESITTRPTASSTIRAIAIAAIASLVALQLINPAELGENASAVLVVVTTVIALTAAIPNINRRLSFNKTKRITFPPFLPRGKG